ncbi:MAG: sporulation protein YunB [Bacilli bacterium]
MKLKKRKKLKPIIIIIILLTTIATSIHYINKIISPKLTEYASIEIKKLSNLIITKSIKTETLEKLNIEDLFIITRNEKDEILTLDINTITLNKIILSSTINIQENLKALEQGKINSNNDENKNGVVLKIPLGQIYNNFLLNNLGPKIPVKLKILGDMETKVNTNIKNYGINNALIEITLDIKVKEKVILPINTEEIIVTQTLPLAMKIIKGTVPNYYSGEINKSSTFSIPIE